MADPPRHPTGDDTGLGSDRGSTTETPRWVKVFAIVALVLVVLFVIVILAGRGNHGPGRHSSGGAGGHTPPSSLPYGVQQP